MLEIKHRSWGDGTETIKTSWRTFKKQWIFWTVFHCAVFLVQNSGFLLSHIGTFFAAFGNTILVGVLMGCVHQQISNPEARSIDVFEDILDTYLQKLIYFAVFVATIKTTSSIGLESYTLSVINTAIEFPELSLEMLNMQKAQEQFHRTLQNIQDPFVVQTLVYQLLGILQVSMIFGVLFFMSIVFVPYLIVVENIKFLPAIRLSFSACQKNLWSLTSLSLWWLLISILGILSCCGGYIISIAIMNISTYHMAQKIFTVKQNP